MSYIEAVNILKLEREFTEQELKQAYRKSSKEYHPDFHGEETEEKMKEINAAYELLKDYVGKRVSHDTKETKSEEKQKNNIYEAEIRQFASKLEISYEQAISQYNTYRISHSYEGSIIDYYNYVIDTYYVHKDEIFSLFNQMQNYNGDIFYIINIYEDNNKDKNVSIVKWLERKVKVKTLADALSITIPVLNKIYKQDVLFGYDKEFHEYIDQLESILSQEPQGIKKFKTILDEYTIKSATEKGKKQFIDYLDYKMLTLKYKTNGEGILFKMFEIAKKEDSSISFYEYICSLMGEYDEKKEYSKK